jgi:hypothetical protein
MGLPKIDAPLFTLELPSTGEKIKYRPFTVKEEKILLIAQESNDIDQIIDSVKQIINNCVIDVRDTDSYPMFDIEFMIMNIRAASVNNVAKFNITDPETEQQVELEFDINDLSVARKENHSQKIALNDNSYISMRYPTINQLQAMVKSLKNKATDQDMLDVMLACIDTVVVNDDQVYKLEEYSQDEVTEFLESMSAKTVDDIKTFFDTMPTLRYEIPYTVDDKEKKFVVEGLETFFM